MKISDKDNKYLENMPLDPDEGDQVHNFVTQRPKYKLNWAIHRGTLMSRDIGEPYTFDTEKKCLDKVKELQKHFGTMGYKIWYANIIYPNGDKKTIIQNY